MKKRWKLPIAVIISISGVHHDCDALPSADVSGQQEV